jgi:peptide deformylase
MFEQLKIIHWPDPRLKKTSTPVEKFDDSLRALTARMLELMKEHRGVGLAAPQVGLNKRVFVINPTGEPADARVYINPVLSDPDGEEEAEEGCLSIPGIHVLVARHKQMKIQAQDVEGQPIAEAATGFIARIWQHENDHLNGVLLTDRMGAVARMTNRKLFKDLEEKFREENPKR